MKHSYLPSDWATWSLATELFAAAANVGATAWLLLSCAQGLVGTLIGELLQLGFVLPRLLGSKLSAVGLLSIRSPHVSILLS